MLKQRLLTAAVLIPLVVWGVLDLPSGAFAAVLAVLVLLGAWEWSGLAGLQTAARRWGYLLLIGALLAGAVSLSGDVARTVIAAAVLWWLAAAVRIYRFNRRGVHNGPVTVDGRRATARALTGTVVLVPAWMALLWIHGNGDDGPYFVLFLLALIWGADSGAYVAGKKWGRHRLAPRVSPGKTWEGVAGGVAAAAVVALVGAVLLDFSGAALWLFIPVCLVTVAFSIAGDLFESLCKREAGVKDSGRLLPGHGGILDRIDSLTAAAPLFAVGLWLLEEVR